MIEIRQIPRMGPLPVKEVNRLLAQLSRNVRPDISMHELDMALSGFHKFVYAACDSERPWPENIVGMAGISFDREPTGWYGKVHTVVRDGSVRGQGVGTLLVETLVAKAQEYAERHRAEIEVSLTSNPSRERANKLYAEFGFKLVAKAHGKHGTNLYKRGFLPKPILF